MTDFSINKETIVTSTKTARTLRRADVMFVLDCTGTMQDTLDAVTNTIGQVAEIYSKSSVQIRFGLVEYRDLTQNQVKNIHRMHRHTFEEGKDFTTNVEAFQGKLNSLQAKGGGPYPESTYDAIATASVSSHWDEKAEKIIVLFSDDIPYRFGEIVSDICALCDLIKLKRIDQLHFVIDRSRPKILERFTTILRCVPDVRDPRLSIFGNTYPIHATDGSKSNFKHLRKTLLNIAKTSGDQAGANTGGSNPYASEESSRQQHISGCAINRKENQETKRAIKREPSPKPQDKPTVNSKETENKTSSRKNPYS